MVGYVDAYNDYPLKAECYLLCVDNDQNIEKKNSGIASKCLQKCLSINFVQ